MVAVVLLLLPHVPQLLQQSFSFLLGLTVPEGPIADVGIENKGQLLLDQLGVTDAG